MLLVTLAAVFVLKLVVLFQLRDHPLTQPDAGLDTTAYVDLAKQVIDGNWGLGPGVYYVSPLYIYFLALALAALKSFTAVRVLQVALGTASVGFIFLSTRVWFGQRAAWIAVALAALTGLFTFYEVLILQASLDAFLTSAALYALTRGLTPDLPPEGGSHRIDRGSSKSGSVAYRGTDLLLAGVVFGIQTLNRPNVMLAALGVAVVMLIATRRVRPAALLVAGLAIGMAPAAIRNLAVAHQWSFVSSHGGLNFYIGNRETATGFYQSVPGITPTIVGQEKDARRVAAQALGHPVTDAEASDYFFGLSRAGSPGIPATPSRSSPGSSISPSTPRMYRSPTPFLSTRTTRRPRFASTSSAWLLIPLGLVGLVSCGPAVTPLAFRRASRSARPGSSSGPRSFPHTAPPSRCSSSRNAIAFRCWCRCAPAPAPRSMRQSMPSGRDDGGR